MKLLAIETSCDDASVAIVEDERDTRPERSRRTSFAPIRILAERTASQIDIHNRYGGVFPELAAREHFATLLPTIEATLKLYAPEADPRETLKSLDAIAVTAGPGLIGSLLVGVTVAQALAMGLGKKLIPVNHLAGHIYSVWLEDVEVPPFEKGDKGGFGANANNQISPYPSLQRGELVPEFPALALTVSGGHTHLVWMEGHGRFDVLGQTRDDAAGEAFDKVSVMLGLGYPGGPAIQAAAADWKLQITNSKSQTNSQIPIPKIPRPMLNEGLEFSFSGLKTAVRYWLDRVGRGGNTPGVNPGNHTPGVEEPRSLPSEIVNAVAYEVQEAITDVLVTKLRRAAEQRHPKSLILAGGVAANSRLREKLIEQIQDLHPRGGAGQLHPWGVGLDAARPAFFISSRAHSTDNGAMIGAAALAMLTTGFEPVDPATVEARSTWPLIGWSRDSF